MKRISAERRERGGDESAMTEKEKNAEADEPRACGNAGRAEFAEV